ncbi:MAG: dTDP-4-dehydrorhamnose reductase [Myxococcota bacterium]
MTEIVVDGTRRGRLRVGVLGAGGQLGRCLVRSIYSGGGAGDGAIEASDFALAFAANRDALDLNDPGAIEPFLDSLEEGAPDLVINAAAYTKVDACETETELAYQTNAISPGEWARRLAARGIGFVHLSTDYVFPGDGDRPYREDDPTEPKTVYGASKRAGEVAVLGSHPNALVARTSWVFGPGRNFVVAILDQAAKRRSGEAEGPLRVVSDQQGCPTSAADLADALLLWARDHAHVEGRAGLLHLSNQGVTTWYGFAREILDQAGYADIEIDPVTSSAFETAAVRPAYSVMSGDRAEALGLAMRPWTDALAGYLAGPDAPDTLDKKAAKSVSEVSG